ncbi:probable ribose-5-phosphate isomerase 4, chloroplastic isoform X3 [Panicum virgatum]|uniref:probable ribose-5-phosphate isomerase 4, chloroplastic isoform X3 n=1 Tax=Panicum virgatum TaxID=38727 RepID=UPI0019D5FB45|nr:probable ribose-5-phosphate isomerase 4, chloroplastic isoform X3 [Panicum virgatum]
MEMMEAMARASVASSAQLRPCPSPRRNRCLPSSVRRPRRRGVACSASAADADVVDLFDAAKLTVDKFVKSGMVVGLGSGPASALAVQYLGTRLRRGSLTDIVAVTSSVLSASEADMAGIRASSYQEGTQIDFAFTDAEVIEEGTLAAVIGQRKTESGEPSFMVEKTMVKSADKLAFITGNDKYLTGVEGSFPVLVKSVWRRPSFGTAGPLGGDHPLVTKEGHHVLDVIFTTPIPDLGQVAEKLEKIAGVVDHGIICSNQSYAVIASKGEVQVIEEKSPVIP